jgi:aminoglycoside 3'-phosphotransferase-2
MESGLVDEDDFDEARLGRTAQDLFKDLLALRPASEDLVFTHGDYTLPNVIFDRGMFSGVVDVGRAGVSDRYRDIALGMRSLRDNLGPGLEAPFLEAYGLALPDWTKVEFFTLIDEFF